MDREKVRMMGHLQTLKDGISKPSDEGFKGLVCMFVLFQGASH